MRELFFLILLVPLLLPGQAKMSTAPPWGPLETLAGQWQGTNQGEPGHGTVERRYEFLFDGKFLQVTNTSTYPSQEKNPKGETHHDVGVFSYDKQRDKLILRQFHSEGFVNEYVLESVAPDGKKISFVTERIENIPAGWRARETYTIVNDHEFIERFELAEPGKEFAVYTESVLKRKQEAR